MPVNIDQSIKEEALQMLRDGIPVGEVVRRTGVHRATVARWRKGAGIPSAKEARSQFNEEKKEEALQMLRDGISGVEVARRTGVGKMTISKWRKGEGIPSVNEHKSYLKKEALQMTRDGIPGAEIARRLGVSKETVRKWRLSAGLPKFSQKAHLKEEALQMVREGITGAETTRRIGVSQTTITKWRKAADYLVKSTTTMFRKRKTTC